LPDGEHLVLLLEDVEKYNKAVDKQERLLCDKNLQFIVYDKASNHILLSTNNNNNVQVGSTTGNIEDEASDGLWEYTDSKFVASKKRINADQSGLELILLTPLTDLQVVQQSFISRIALVFIIGSIVAILLSYFVTGKLVTPLERLK